MPHAAHRPLGFVLAAVLLGSAPAFADTIVLKNGRRILAGNVTEEGDKVTYETSAGRLSLPKSIVDRIERGAAAFHGGPEQSATSLAIAPPVVEVITSEYAGPAEEISRAAVHNAAIDHEYIARLEAEARSDRPHAGERAAIAHHAASQFELRRGDFEHALAEERTALIFAPEQPGLLLSIAYLHLRRSEYKQALDYLAGARRVVPDSFEVAKLGGWAYYGLNKLREAAGEWERALALRPDAEVQKALEKVQRDLFEEENYRENESSHFTLRYTGAAEPALAREILRTLENHFSAMESEIRFTPPEPIGVVLYTREIFADITRAPGWVGALNDGRIRVPVQGLTGVSPELSRVLKHELTHSFLTQKTRGLCPIWLNEGLAEWMEGHRSGESAAELVLAYDQGQILPLGTLEGSWMRLPNDQVHFAYLWSLATLEYIVQSGGMTDVILILERIASGSSPEAVLREVLHSDYGDLMQSTAGYLRKSYLR